MMRDVGRWEGVGRRRRRKQRTPNMGRSINCMSVTLEVSKLSGWLNADAPCADSRTEGTRCWARFGPGGGRRKGWCKQRRWCKQRAGERARLQIGGRARGGAHAEHVFHVFDAGGVEAQRLVERPRALPRVERRACGAGRGADREAGGGGRPRCMQRAGEGSTADWEQGTGRSARKTCVPCL